MIKLLPIITIDGPAGVGKSTVSGAISKKLDLPHLDTGAMFRYAALAMGPNGSALPEETLGKEMQKLNFTLEGKGADARLFCNGKPIGAEIRTEQVAMLASRLAKLPVVRQYLLQCQRELAARHKLVTEGRDMGTVVFPNAAFKFFLEGSPATRALRRKHDLAKLGIDADIAQLEKELEARDREDRNRAIAPLRPAADAIIVDTSHLDAAGVLAEVLAFIQAREKETGLCLAGD